MFLIQVKEGRSIVPQNNEQYQPCRRAQRNALGDNPFWANATQPCYL